MSVRQTRLDRKFAALKSEGRKAFIAFVTAGDPDPETSFSILSGLRRRRRHYRAGHALHRPDGGRAVNSGRLATRQAGQTLEKTLYGRPFSR